MKINYKNQDLKIISRNRGGRCGSCAFNCHHLFWCSLFCRPYKMWIKDIFNSDIFCL